MNGSGAIVPHARDAGHGTRRRRTRSHQIFPWGTRPQVCLSTVIAPPVPFLAPVRSCALKCQPPSYESASRGTWLREYRLHSLRQGLPIQGQACQKPPRGPAAKTHRPASARRSRRLFERTAASSSSLQLCRQEAAARVRHHRGPVLVRCWMKCRLASKVASFRRRIWKGYQGSFRLNGNP